MMIMWLYNRCVYDDKEEKLDDVRLHINVSSEESVEKLEDKLEPRERISYKEKLRVTGLIPLTTKLDINAIIEVSEALSGRKRIPEVKKRETRSQRIGPLAAVPIPKNNKRPNDILRKLQNSPIVKAIEGFNNLDKNVREKYMKKNTFKEEMNKIAKTYDTLNENGLALDRLKLTNIMTTQETTQLN